MVLFPSCLAGFWGFHPYMRLFSLKTFLWLVLYRILNICEVETYYSLFRTKNVYTVLCLHRHHAQCHDKYTKPFPSVWWKHSSTWTTGHWVNTKSPAPTFSLYRWLCHWLISCHVWGGTHVLKVKLRADSFYPSSPAAMHQPINNKKLSNIISLW